MTEPDIGPLFGNSATQGDTDSGTIYLLSSKSKDSQITDIRAVLHKNGVTGNDVESRVAQAHLDTTFLLAEVEIVATYVLYNVNRVKLENLIHRFFEPARLELEMKDRFGRAFRPREWLLVPLPAIDAAVEHIRNGTITEFEYDRDAAEIVKRKERKVSHPQCSPS